MAPTFAGTNPAAKESKLKKLRSVFHRTSSSPGPLAGTGSSSAQSNIASHQSSNLDPNVAHDGKPSSSSIPLTPSSSNITINQAVDPQIVPIVPSQASPQNVVSSVSGSASSKKYVLQTDISKNEIINIRLC